jgi:hypothetical protein
MFCGVEIVEVGPRMNIRAFSRRLLREGGTLALDGGSGSLEERMSFGHLFDVRPSAFGFLSDLGFRPSDFAHNHTLEIVENSTA